MSDTELWLPVRLAILLPSGNPAAVQRRATERKTLVEVVMERFRRALEAQEQYGEVAPFEVWEATSPGSLDVRVFDQDEVWVDVLRVPHHIANRDDLADDYLCNLIAFLTTVAGHMLLTVTPNGDYFRAIRHRD